MWYVIQVINGREDVMRERIERMVPAGAMQELFYPQYQTEIKVHGEWVNTTKPLFPGYLICDTADPRTVQQYLLRMDDFARVLSQDGQFAPLAKEEVQLIGSFTHVGDRVVPMSEALKDGDLVLTLAGQNSVTESHAPDADITLCGMEVWGNLTLRGAGTLTATGSQCGIHVSQALVVDGCTVDARADGADITDEAVAGVIAGDMAVRGGGRVVAAGAGYGAGVRAYGVYLQDAGLGDGAVGCRLSVDASRLDATGADSGVACTGGSLVSARFVTPADGAFGASGVLDASGAMAPHVVVVPDVATPPAGETDRGEVTGDSADKPPADASPAAGEPTTVPTANPSMRPAATTTKTTTTVTKTTVVKVLKPKAATVTTAALPKTGDNNWVVASVALFLLGTVLLAAAYRC